MFFVCKIVCWPMVISLYLVCMHPNWELCEVSPSYFRDQNGFWPKGLKVHSAALCNVCTCLLNERLRTWNETSSFGEVWGSSPRNFLASWVANGAFQCAFGLPPPLQKNFLFRFTLISRMVLGVGKRSEIRLKSENFDPCIYNLSLKPAPHGSYFKGNELTELS